MRLAIYISGHGFGHLAQLAPVLNRLQLIRPDCSCLIRTSLPEDELRARIHFDFELDSDPVDLGVIQKSAIEEDCEASIAAMREWTSTMDDRIAREVAVLKQFGPDIVLSNISPLAFPAARSAGVPSVGLATLDWYTIYSHWLKPDDTVVTSLKAAYEACDLLLTPPMAMDMAVFPKRKPIPLIAATPVDVGIELDPGWKRRALVIFGGAGQPAFDTQALAAMPEWQFLIPGAPAHSPANVQSIRFDNHLRAVDLMPHVDVVVCKPGYGILAECWRTGTPIAWVERPEFPEFPMLRQWLDDVFPSCGMRRDCFQQGSWLPALIGALTSPRSFPELEHNGEDVAAELILYGCKNRSSRE